MGAIIKLLLLVFVGVQIYNALSRHAARRRDPRRNGETPHGTQRDYADLTPYDIEDADFEELPGKKE